jgi:anthrone oxygenase-like protein
VLTAVVMALSLAHALELPGKLRLSREQYLAVQTIYYPGFTVGGVAEPLGIIVLAGLLFLLPAGSKASWLTAVALALLLIVQLLFWAVVQPVNRHWLQTVKLTAAAGRFFEARAAAESYDWIELRNRWERGHLARSAAATLAFVAATLALAAH